MLSAEERAPLLTDERIVYGGVEHGEIDIPLSVLLSDGGLDLYPEVLGQGLFTIQLKRNSLVFAAGHYVGLIPINDRVAIDIQPRVPANLARVLAIGGHAPKELPGFIRRYERTGDWTPSLLDTYARALIEVLGSIELAGLYREYRRVTRDTTTPRGRIHATDTIRFHWARGHRERIRTTLYEQTVDNGANRALKYAVWYLASQYSRVQPRTGTRRLIAELNRVYHLFDRVPLDRGLSFRADALFLDPGQLPANRTYYRQPLELARVIVDSQGLVIEGSGDDVSVPPLLVDMNRAFEAYLREVLIRELAPFGGSIAVLDGNKGGAGGARKPLFDTSPSEDATPDIVVRLARPPAPTKTAVIEVKYIARNFGSEEVYQAISYAASYRARAVLVRPSTGGLGSSAALGTIDGYDLDAYVFGLGEADLVEEERRFSTFVARLLTAADKE